MNLYNTAILKSFGNDGKQCVTNITAVNFELHFTNANKTELL